MATPAVSGIAALVLEEVANQALDLSAAGVKAVLIQTAQDVAGVGQATVGPDFSTGWGIADAEAAADLLHRPAGPGVAEETLAAAGTAGAYTQAFLVPSGEPELKVTLASSDPAGSTTAAQTQPRLVNDLDLRLINPTGGTVTPWSLNAANPGAAAVRNGGGDALNHVEQVSVLNPAAGVWQVQVTAKPTSFAGPQDFALAGPFSPASGPFTSDPADIMMVMDGSGSMNAPSATPGISKLGALKSAAEEVANFLEIVVGPRGVLDERRRDVAYLRSSADRRRLDRDGGGRHRRHDRGRCDQYHRRGLDGGGSALRTQRRQRTASGDPLLRRQAQPTLRLGCGRYR